MGISLATGGGAGPGTPAAVCGGHPLEAVHERGEMATVGGKLTSRWMYSGSPLNSASSHPKSAYAFRMIWPVRSRRAADTSCRYLPTKVD